MPALFVCGNVKEDTFANTIVAADHTARESNGEGLRDVFVLHSPQSEERLHTNTAWKDHLKDFEIDPGIIVHFTVDLATSGSIEKVIRHMERCIGSLDRGQEVYVDLTNGTSLYKTVLSNSAYVLGIRNQYLLNTNVVRQRGGGYLAPSDLRSAWTRFPDLRELDSLARASLTDVRRYRSEASIASLRVSGLCGETVVPSVDVASDILNGVSAWFSGERSDDATQIAAGIRSVGRALESTISEACAAYAVDFGKGGAAAIERLREPLTRKIGSRDTDLLMRAARLTWEIRNRATHEDVPEAVGHINARLAAELLFGTVEYLASDSRQNTHDGGGSAAEEGEPEMRMDEVEEGNEGEEYYFGLDGDDTGRELESMFANNQSEDEFQAFSHAIRKAVKRVHEMVARFPEGRVIFSEGDDVLFYARYSESRIGELIRCYQHESGRTCSIGYGPSVRDAYVALKMAKARPGKESVVGVVPKTSASHDHAGGTSHDV